MPFKLIELCYQLIESNCQNAHALHSLISPPQFKAGAYNLAEFTPTERDYNLAGVIVHGDYNTVTLANDIALLITTKDIEFKDNANIGTISLPQQADIAQLYAEGAPATVIGLVDLPSK